MNYQNWSAEVTCALGGIIPVPRCLPPPTSQPSHARGLRRDLFSKNFVCHFARCCDKICDKEQFKEGKVYSLKRTQLKGYRSRASWWGSGGDRSLRWKITLHTWSGRKLMLAFSFVLRPGSQQMEWYCPQIKVKFILKGTANRIT